MGTKRRHKASRSDENPTQLPRDTVAQIRDSERIWHGFMQLELQMFSARSLEDLLSSLVYGLRDTFQDVDAVTWACIDPDFEIQRLLEQGSPDQTILESFVPMPEEYIRSLFRDNDQPILGKPKSKMIKTLFPRQFKKIHSVAIAPLYLRGELIGCINQGSTNGDHFREDVATTFLEHMAAVVAMCIDNVISHERLKLDGLTDGLTEVFNRRFFEQRLHDEVERWERTAQPLSCMFVDIDFFKQVNDNHGHQTGDRVLQQVARVLGSELRSSDILARYGGEEFVLLLPDTSQVTAAKIADRLRSLVENMKLSKLLGVPLNVSVSIGLAVLSDDYQDNDDQPASEWLIAQADKALYQAKGSGRNRVIVAAHS